jgi:EAL domain-containing protein (putative c-di-GMP-specific phosphodiesterase class I)
MRARSGDWVPPGEFISVVEQSDLIVPLTECVLEQSLEALSMLRRTGLCRSDAPVAINLAPTHLLSGEVPGMVAAALDRVQLPPSALKVEITETALMDNLEQAVEQLKILRKLGCKIAIDDFGTGYSSLEYLHTLPLDVLKLDRVFVQQIDTSPKTAAIAKTVCDLAKLLSLDVVAEGVESAAHVSALTDMGVTLLQGFYFSKPLSRPALEHWLIDYEREGLEHGRRA